ncbi:hypothetical protein Pcinc_025027 [Petrolisthes cinctipes]|uniref:Enkurin domain-containing protein n=1 Tax=Petrolisthes cinctipes TaxID=88211 RepID=A0AAE1F9C9_PETCI|nr:hypothetical protein Pcinc_025027 [Petrolisthes cinctipes]
MSLPAMRRGLSPEGRRNRDRQLGSLTIGLQGVTVHPTHKAGKSETNFIAENVRRLHQIQTKCRQRGTNSRAPLRATRHPSLSKLEGSDGSVGSMVKRQSVERDGSAHSDYFSLSEDQPDAPPPSLYSGEVVGVNEEQYRHPSSPLHPLSIPLQDGTQEPISQFSTLSLSGCKPPSKMGHIARPQSPDGHNSRSQSPMGHSFRQQGQNLHGSMVQSPIIVNSRPNSPVVLEPIATRLTQTKPEKLGLGTGNCLNSHQRMFMGGSSRNSEQTVLSNGYSTDIGVTEPIENGAGLGNLGLLGTEPLSPEGRKQRMDMILTRIKSQKPSCEIDFNKHYKVIQNQHRMLLDNSERLSLYGSGQGSRENLPRSRSSSRPGSAGSVRSVSWDRNTHKTTNGNNNQKSVRPSTVVGEVRGLRQQNHPVSPNIKKKLVKTSGTTNRTGVDPHTGGGQKGRKQAAGERDKISGQKYLKDNLSKVQSLTRAKSNLERSRINKDNHTSPTKQEVTSKQNQNNVDTRLDLDCTHSSVEGHNLNSTISSTSDFNLVGGDQLGGYEPKLKLNIRPDSNASDVNGRGSVQFLDSSRGDFSLDSYNPYYCEQGTGGRENVDIVEKYLNQNVKNVSENNVEMRHMIESKRNHLENKNSECIYHPEGVESLDNQEHLMVTERTGNFDNNSCDKTERYGMQCKDNHEITADVVTSTPVPNTSNQAMSSRSNSPQLKKTQGGGNECVKSRKDQACSSRSTLRRSQSLKNIQQQQQQQRRPGDVPLTYKKGKIPRYLAARREEERRAAEAALAVDPACPPGHSPLPDSDRLNTLYLLRRSQSEVLHELASLPVAQDTLRVKRVRQDLEDKLTQIEDGLRIFSQPKVYIMNDE